MSKLVPQTDITLFYTTPRYTLMLELRTILRDCNHTNLVTFSLLALQLREAPATTVNPLSLVCSRSLEQQHGGIKPILQIYIT